MIRIFDADRTNTCVRAYGTPASASRAAEPAPKGWEPLEGGAPGKAAAKAASATKARIEEYKTKLAELNASYADVAQLFDEQEDAEEGGTASKASKRSQPIRPLSATEMVAHAGSIIDTCARLRAAKDKISFVLVLRERPHLYHEYTAAQAILKRAKGV